MATANHSKCFFLDVLPAELRIAIYDLLVVSDQPLRGQSARDETHQHNLDLTILRTNRQIHAEALDTFFCKNTFYITSIPEDTAPPTASLSLTDKEDDENADQNDEQEQETPPPTLPRTLGQFDPPLPPSTWSKIRNLTIDLLFHPSQPVTATNFPMGWKPNDPGAAAYIGTLIRILSSLSPSLQTLSLTAEVRDPFCARKCLVSFFMCDRDRSFARALASVTSPKIGTVPMSFEFPDCYYRTEVRKDVFLSKSILLLACQVMFCQSQVRIDELLAAFEDGRLKAMPVRDRADLKGLVERGAWVGLGKGGVE
ncbi:hypothetical protein B0J11DRAFT_100726 [Dendryphion nanum]|uniref:Uncharacterized protein n=1 Tax=Dendryphion nanum TaxID=256645 RepID=A0A9P9IED7_9PLEO|nr:hypothetical protein B0J11DRAFT_100726 [Dendryphion nanum]